MDKGQRDQSRLSTCRLYLISPPRIAPTDFSGVLKDALKGGDVASFQLRLKHVSDDEIRRATDTLRPIVQAAGAAFILNDRPDLAAELGCDGVHVGQEDASYAEARAALPNSIVGVTCHDSRHLAMDAGEAGADYVAFGAFFPTQTKEPKSVADIELLQWWAQAMVVPVVAIGGITIANAPALITAGADFLAVAAGVWEHGGGPQEAVREFNTLFKA
jgi:thiamine-phosphate pyrophosphorylase